MFSLAEVAPAAPALGPLVALAVLLVAFGLVFVVRRFVRAIFGPIIAVASKVPGLGGVLSSALHAIEQAISNALGSAEHAIEHAMASSWHLLARYMDWLWREIRGNAYLLEHTLAGLVPLVAAYHLIRNLAHRLEKAWHGIEHGVKTLTKALHGIEHRVRSLERDLAKGIGHDLRLTVKALDKELHRVENKVIPAIQSAEADTQSALDNLYEWAKGKASLVGVGTFATAVTAVLAAVGLDWLACRSRDNVNGKKGCGLWDDIEGLLGLAVATAIAVDFEQFVHDAQAATEATIGAVKDVSGL